MKQIVGYVLGFSIFIAGIPVLMWWVSGWPAWADLPVGRLYLALLIALWNGWALLAVAAVMMQQVRSEEKRLEADFGEEYLDYKKRTRRFFTLGGRRQTPGSRE